jgi:hypothetical protein
MTPKQIRKLVEYLQFVEADVSQCSNHTKASDKAYDRIVKNCKEASKLIDELMILK